MYAERVDHLEGHDEWRKRPDSLLYNHKVLFTQQFCCDSTFLVICCFGSGRMVNKKERFTYIIY